MQCITKMISAVYARACYKYSVILELFSGRLEFQLANWDEGVDFKVIRQVLGRKALGRGRLGLCHVILPYLPLWFVSVLGPTSQSPTDWVAQFWRLFAWDCSADRLTLLRAWGHLFHASCLAAGQFFPGCWPHLVPRRVILIFGLIFTCPFLVTKFFLLWADTSYVGIARLPQLWPY